MQLEIPHSLIMKSDKLILKLRTRNKDFQITGWCICRNDFVDDKGCLLQSTNMHGMYITMMRKLQVRSKEAPPN